MPKLTQRIMKTSYSGFFIDDIVRIYSWPPIISYHMYIHFSQHIPALSATILTNPQAAFEEGTLTGKCRETRKVSVLGMRLLLLSCDKDIRTQ